MKREDLKLKIDNMLSPGEGADPSTITTIIDEILGENDRLEAELNLARSTADNYKSAYIRDFMGKESKDVVEEKENIEIETDEDMEEEKIKIEDVLDL